MGLHINRRQWLKTSAIAAAGLIAGPNFTTCRRDTSVPRLSSGGEDFIRLNNNESPYGISKGAREAIKGAISESHRYPYRHYPELKELIADREKVFPDNIILGAGSTDVMTTLIHFYGTKGKILAADPTYFDFVYYAEKAGCFLNKVPLNGHFAHDLQAMEKRISRETSLIYICNPNNPTASLTPGDKLRPFCKRASKKALVVVDEAYHEYVEDASYASMIDLVREGENIIVTRTFSKIFGLAGMRVGYGITRPDIIEDLARIERNFAPIAFPSLKAAVATYKAMEFYRYVREKNREVKSYLYKELDQLGFFTVPSHTNFVLFKVNRDSSEMAQEFEKRHILIRPFVFKGDNWLRVSLGTMEEMRIFVSVLADIG
jgi:histidinol-phosphate aminotransferase